jgi:type IV fimbrial biogenesis protein FimT
MPLSGSAINPFMKPSKGFSLLELLTTIALMAVLSAIAIPNVISMMPKYRLGGSAREILTILHYSKMAAIKENSNVVVNFNSGANNCAVFVDDGEGGGTAEDGIRNGSERILKHYGMPSGVNLLAPTFGSALSFNNRGFADLALEGVITVQNSMGNRKVRVLPSGHCKIL